MSRGRARVLNLAFADESESEEEVVRRSRWIRERTCDFDTLDDRDFRMRYRLSKSTVLSVLEQIEGELEFSTDRNFAVSPVNQLLCALRFYATGCFQATAGDLTGMSASTVCRVVKKVSCAIASLRQRHIRFPETAEEIRSTQLEFYRKARFPLVVGAIDCTHIKLWQSPGGDAPERFRNRKGFYSLNVQVICNANMEINDIVARYDGSTHDSRIFRECRRRRLFEEGVYGDAKLVGDGGYASRPYMMTPLTECHTPAENLYNESQIRTRNVVERLFGVWKRRFPALALGLRVKLETVFPILTATAILHNMARRAGEEVPNTSEVVLPAPWEEVLAQDDVSTPLLEDTRPPRRASQNNRVRQELINNYFARLATREQ